MKKLVSTRRQLFDAIAAGVAIVPFFASTRKAVSAASEQGCESSGGRANGCQTGTGASCFLKGTKIAIPSGLRRVEDLQIGDEILTLSGCKLIKWIGYRKFTKEKHKAWQHSVMPIHVAPFAINDHSPCADLYLSPMHCIFFNDVLIPVKYLINGTSIAQGTPSGASTIEYYHIELDTHEVLYAEGALVESFIEECSERENFANFVQYERLYGAEHQPRMTPFAPILGYHSRSQKLQGLVRSLVSNVVDIRDSIQIARDHLAKRAAARNKISLASGV
jgi:hypothetical protein